MVRYTPDGTQPEGAVIWPKPRAAFQFLWFARRRWHPPGLAHLWDIWGFYPHLRLDRSDRPLRLEGPE